MIVGSALLLAAPDRKYWNGVRIVWASDVIDNIYEHELPEKEMEQIDAILEHSLQSWSFSSLVTDLPSAFCSPSRAPPILSKLLAAQDAHGVFDFCQQIANSERRNFVLLWNKGVPEI